MLNQEKIYIYIDIEGLCGCPGGDGGGRGGGRRFLVGLGCFCTERDRYGGGTVWVRRGGDR